MTIKGFLIRKDGWCIVGVGGDTESGDSWKRCPMDIGSLGLVEALVTLSAVLFSIIYLRLCGFGFR
jgi:hypothetical protein